MLIPPVLLKVASTGYRLVRYYRGSAPYVRKGPPPILLRVLGPLLVLSTGALLATGLALLVIGPGGSASSAACTRSASSCSSPSRACTCWPISGRCRRDRGRLKARATRLTGATGRRAVVVGSLVAGLALGAVAIAYDGAWVHRSHRGETAAVAP